MEMKLEDLSHIYTWNRLPATCNNREEKLQAEAAAEIGAAELPCNISAKDG